MLHSNFTKTNSKITNQKEFRIEKGISRKDGKLYVNVKDKIIMFNSLIDKKDIVERSECFPKRNSLGANIKVELDLSNYATKTKLKNATAVAKKLI